MFDWGDQECIEGSKGSYLEGPANPLLLHVVDVALDLLSPMHMLPLEHCAVHLLCEISESIFRFFWFLYKYRF